MSEILSYDEASTGAPDWRVIGDKLHLVAKAKGFPAAIDFVSAVASIAEDQQHHPDIDIRFNRVFIAVSSHDVGGITERDVRFANAVADEARARELTMAAHPLTTVEVGIDCRDPERIAPFWAAILGGKVQGERHDVVDPFSRTPLIWFQKTDSPAEQRGRTHLDIGVPRDEASSRIKAAVAAGGHIVDDSHLPSFCVLGDADGNVACVCSCEGRGIKGGDD